MSSKLSKCQLDADSEVATKFRRRWPEPFYHAVFSTVLVTHDFGLMLVFPQVNVQPGRECLQNFAKRPERAGRQMGLFCVLHPLPRTARVGLGPRPHSLLPSWTGPGRGLWRRNAVEMPVPRQFGERRWRGSRGRRELVSCPSVSFPSFSASPDPAHLLEGHRDPDSRWGMGVKEREVN